VNGDTPLPILIANERAPGQLLIGGNATVFEFNPWELGTFDPSIHGFAPLRYLGSNFTNGSLPDDEPCVRGFDNAGYIMGTSSSLFNQFLLQLDTADHVPDAVRNFARTVLEKFGRANNDIADYSPNPFLGFRNSSSSSRVGRLTLVDGGSDLQNIPLHPLIQPERHVDVIFAIDSSADTENYWPNGTAMVATYERSLTPLSNGTSFPSVPDQNTFVNLGLNTRPTFFGCDSSNTTNMTPLVVYIPNAPYVFNSNVSTFDPRHETNERNAIVQNGYAVATMGNGTSDEKWPVCVGCAILSRSLERTKTTVPDICRECFERYCWDGTVNSTQPRPYEPKIRLEAIETDEKEGRASGQERGAYFAATLAIAAMIMVGL
jgi:lysophospholipase